MTRAVCALLASFAASAAMAGAPAGNSDLARTTGKATEQFVLCFTAAQDRSAQPWWFVPRENGGGTLSNRGARGVKAPYYLTVWDFGSTREIRLEPANAAASDGAVLRAVDSCV